MTWILDDVVFDFFRKIPHSFGEELNLANTL